MRLNGAAAILAQTIPAVAREAADTSYEDIITKLKWHATKKNTKFSIRNKKHVRSSRTPTSTHFGQSFPECDPDVGLLTCGFGNYCVPQKSLLSVDSVSPIMKPITENYNNTNRTEIWALPGRSTTFVPLTQPTMEFRSVIARLGTLKLAQERFHVRVGKHAWKGAMIRAT